MVRDSVAKRILVFEALGFCSAIVLLWASELFDLAHVIFYTGPTPVNWAECLMESIFVAFLGFLVWVGTQQLLARIQYLEGFLPVCRYCRKIRVGDEWMQIEQYMEKYWQEAVSRGLCPECAERAREIDSKVSGEVPESHQ